MAPLSSLLVKSHVLHKTLSDFYVLTDELVSEKSLASRSFEDKLLHVFSRSPLRAVQFISHLTVLLLLVLQIHTNSLLVRLRPSIFKWITACLIFGICIDVLSTLQPYRQEENESVEKSLENIHSNLSLSVRSPAAISVMLCLINLVSIAKLFRKSFADIPATSIYGMRLISLVQAAPSTIMLLALSSNELFKQYAPVISSWWESPKDEPCIRDDTINLVDSINIEDDEKFVQIQHGLEDDSVGSSHSLIFKLLSDTQQYGIFLMFYSSLSLLRKVMEQTRESMLSVLVTVCYSLIILQAFSHVYRELCASENGLLFSVRAALFRKTSEKNLNEIIAESVQNGVKNLLSGYSSLVQTFTEMYGEQEVEDVEEEEDDEAGRGDATLYEHMQEDHDSNDIIMNNNEFSTKISSNWNSYRRQHVVLLDALKKLRKKGPQKQKDSAGLQDSLDLLRDDFLCIEDNASITEDDDDLAVGNCELPELEPNDVSMFSMKDDDDDNDDQIESQANSHMANTLDNENDFGKVMIAKEVSWKGDDNCMQPALEGIAVQDGYTAIVKVKEGKQMVHLSAQETELIKNGEREVIIDPGAALLTELEEEMADETEDSSEYQYEYSYEDGDNHSEPLQHSRSSRLVDHLLPESSQPILDPNEIVVDLDYNSSIESISISDDARKKQVTDAVLENEAPPLFFDDDDEDDGDDNHN